MKRYLVLNHILGVAFVVNTRYKCEHLQIVKELYRKDLV